MSTYGASFPPIQPLKFFLEPPTTNDIYNTTWMDNYYMQEIAPSHMRRNMFRGQNNAYFSLFNSDDFITVVLNVVLSTYDFSISLDFEDKDGNTTNVPNASTLTFTTRAGNVYNANGAIPDEQLVYFQYKFKPSTVISTNVGAYRLKLSVGTDSGTLIYYSEWLNIQSNHKNTLLVNYDHNINDYGVFWDMNPSMNLRLPAYKRYGKPIYQDEQYRDQNVELRLLSSESYRVFELYFEPISDFHVDKLRLANQCNTIFLEGKRIIKDDSGDFSPTPIPNIPLYRLNYQINEYYPREAGEFFGGIELSIIELGATGGFPYCIDKLSFSKIYGAGSSLPNFLATYPNYIAEILDSTMETAFIVQLNVNAILLGLTGTFVASGGYLLYQNGTGESYVLNEFSALRRALRVEMDCAIDAKITISATQNAGGKTVISLWDVSTGLNAIDPVMYDSSSLSATNTAPTTDSHYAYIYCNDKQVTLSISNALYAGGDRSLSFTPTDSGNVSAILTRIDLKGLDSATFNTTILRSAALTLYVLNIEYSNFEEFTAGSLSVVSAGDWQNLLYVLLNRNEMSDTNQDDFYNDFNTEIADYYYAFGGAVGGLETASQTTPSAPTAASAASRSALLIKGYGISY